MARFEKPKDKTYITRKDAEALQGNAERWRKSGTATELQMAKAADELLTKVEIINDN